MIKDKQLTLASNFQTYRVLNEKGIDSLLWEDCYNKDDLLSLHRKFKTYCNEWYFDELGNDCSAYNGMSIGTAISNSISYDIESWIRVFYLFEYLTSNKINTNFYVLNKEYFPSEVYDYIDDINKAYDSQITIISLDLTDSGIEPSVNQLVSVQRYLSKLKNTSHSRLLRLLDYIKSIFIPTKQEKIRCLILHIRNPEEYLGSFFAYRQKTANLRLFFDSHYFNRNRIAANDFFYNKTSFISENPYNLDLDRSFVKAYIERLLHCAMISLKNRDFLSKEGKKIFQKIFIDYLRKVLHEQIVRYSYLLRIIQKYKINATFCSGLDVPESLYCKHLMEKQGDHSYFMSHGLVGKDQQIIGIKDLAHHYIFFSESEKRIFSKWYDIPVKNCSLVNYFETYSIKDYKKYSNVKVLILLDNFQVGLNSRINCFKSFTDLYMILKDHSIYDITVRPHGAFYNSYSSSNITEDDKEKYFYSLPIQHKSRLALKSIINKYDIVIGPHTTCIYEAMLANVFFIPFIPNFFPADSIDKIVEMYWFPELYPQPCQTIDDVKSALNKFIKSPKKEYDKYLSSIRNIGISSVSSRLIWEKMSSQFGTK
jgi:hypothetical protein